MNKKYGIITSISLLVFAAAAVTAAPPTSYYLPLETNDPTCAPGDLNCDVELNFLTTEVDGDITNEIQDLSLSGSTLSLSGSTGAPIDLSGLSGMDTDDQTLSLSGVILSIADGNDTDLSPAITSLQPWFGTDDNAGATLNTEDMYAMGNVMVGTGSINGARLTVESDTDGLLSLYNSVDNADSFRIVSSNSGGGVYYMRAEAAGTNMVFNEVSGNIGVGGTWSPSARFTVTNNDSATTDSFRVSTSGSNSGTQFIVNGNGNVGVGIHSPTESLDVNGTARVRTLGTGTGSDSIVTADSTGVLRQLPISSLAGMGSPWFGSDDNMSATDNTEEIYHMNNVGIGVIDPQNRLHIAHNNSLIRFTENDASADNKDWVFGANAESLSIGARNDANVGGGNTFAFERDGNNVTDFQGRNSGSPWFTINNVHQRVGIGTTDPQTKLHVSGAGQVYSRIESTSDSWMGLQLESGATGSGSFLVGIRPGGDYAIRNNSGTGPVVHYQINNETGNHFIAPTSGNVGIGTNSSPTSKLQVVGLPIHADNATAIAAGLTAGAFYHNGDGIVRVVF